MWKTALSSCTPLTYFIDLRKIRTGAMCYCRSTKIKKFQLFVRKITGMSHHCLKKNKTNNFRKNTIFFSICKYFAALLLTAKMAPVTVKGKGMPFLNETFEIKKGGTLINFNKPEIPLPIFIYLYKKMGYLVVVVFVTYEQLQETKERTAYLA